MARKITRRQKNAFIKDVLAVFDKHKLELKHYYIEYDEFRSDNSYYVTRPSYGDRYIIASAL